VAELEALRREHGNVVAYLERKEAERHRAEQKRKGTLGELLAAYVEKLKRERKQSAREVENAFRLHVREAQPDLVRLKAAEVTPADIHAILSRIEASRRTRMVNKMRTMLHAAFSYAARSAYDPRRAQGAASFGLESNPVSLTMKVSEFERTSDRVLSADELAAYWRHLDQVPSVVVRGFLRAQMLLGGQRIAQLARLKHRDINFDSRIIRLQDSKGRDGKLRDHLLPLTDRGRQTLEAVPHIESVEGWRFTNGGQAALAPHTVSRAVNDYADWLVQNAKSKPFSAADLRRTCETRLAELGVSKEHRAQLLSQGISGVQDKHYDRWAYIPDKREALMRWEAYLDGLLDPKRKVIDFTGRKKRRQA
jgi:integrase